MIRYWGQPPNEVEVAGRDYLEPEEKPVKPYYTPGGNWRASYPGKVCSVCGGSYTAHSKTQKFCSKKCAGVHRGIISGGSHTERVCPGCGKKWSGPPSNPSRYCSKSCIYESGKWMRPREAKCEACEKLFMSKWKSDRGEWEIYCSRECSDAGHREERIYKTCLNCGKGFDHNHWRDDTTCSWECRNEYYRRDRAAAWKGGVYQAQNRPFRRIDREGYAGKYEGEHRLIAARVIGRSLQRGEVILCIDKDHKNLSPENLFLCPNYREFGMINSSSVEWPQESNLKNYREIGYVRPNVILFLHEWENSKRPANSKNAKFFTRHPQADEIIKRRKAGATLRDLASAFGMSTSGMFHVLKERL